MVNYNFEPIHPVLIPIVPAEGSTGAIVNGTSAADYVDEDYVDADGDYLLSGYNTVLLGSRADTFIGGIGHNDVTGGGGGDTLMGVTGYNILNGNGGNDVIDTGTMNSAVFGGNGDDDLILDVSIGADHTASGGAGADLFSITGLADNRASLTTITDFNELEDRVEIDGIDITDLDLDTSDVIVNGADVYLRLGDTSLALFEDLFLDVDTSLFETPIQGTDGNDQFTLGSSDTNGAQITNGDDIIFLGDGDDFVRLGKGDDIAFGGAGNDELRGQKGNNMLYGEDGDDILDSGAHASVLNGGAGDDWLMANLRRNGEHILSGGQGSDVFEFYSNNASNSGSAVVQDFQIGEDTLVLNGSFNGLFVDLQDTEDGLLVAFDNGAEALFLGLDTDDAFALGLYDIPIVG